MNMASRKKRQKSSDVYKLMYGTCPDEECQTKLFFPSYDKSIECTGCGQRRERSVITNVAEVTNPEVALHNLLKNVLLGNVKPKKGADDVKVIGLSNYVCKLVSPILTYYGMDKTGKAKLLSEMGKNSVFDVSVLGDRSFVIEEENLDVIGYGRDKTGSIAYLADTLKDIESFNDHESRLIPIHADGDGHCLVHAISRALVGRELFWHALRVNLKAHMIEHLDKYKQLFHDFVDTDEWVTIIDECDPYYIPPDGDALGLRNIHIFGLANVLHRPIILLDSKSGLVSSGDYSGVFLPGFVDPAQCLRKDGTPNKPLCIAWSSSGRNHYIPLVGIKGKPKANIPSYMAEKSWGMPKEEIKKYIEFDTNNCCIVGGDKSLTERYLKQLVSAMEEIFIEKYNVNPSLVADVHQYIYKSSGVVGVHPDEVIERTKLSIQGEQLYRCLMCDALIEYILDKDMFERGGSLHNLALKIHKKLDTNKLYSFPIQGAVCSYDEDKDCLIPDKKRSKPKACAFCSGGMLRKVAADGSVEYINGDRTSTPCVGSKCPCGFKHFWNGKEYDNLPELIPVSLHWGGKTVTEEIAWFQSETDNTLDSNVFEVAQNLVQKHFPGEFGSERMVQQVVDSILAQSAASLKEGGATQRQDSEKPMDTFNPETASKIILTGFKKKTMHKEELVKSEKEKQVLSNIQTHAPKMQQKKTTKDTAATKAHSELASVESSGDQFMGEKMDQSLSAGSDSVQGEKKVRVQTSDGRQVMLTLVKDVTYSELRKLMYDAVGVQADCQKIRIGFPPKLLEGNEDTLLDIKHGDKITLEVLLDKAPDVKICEEASGHSEASWRGFEEDAHSQTAEKLLQALRDVDHGGDSIDTSIASLGILSAVSGKDMWTNVQSMPHLFSVGGLLYQQVKRDLGLIDGKHCQLPCLPGKVFRYNATDDRLELCLEPHGHFQVEPRIEAQVMEGLRTDARSQAKFGASGAVHQPSDRAAFSGQGHTLKSSMGADARMPGDLEYTPRAPHARGFHDLCSLPGSNTESICEEPEQEEHAAHEMKTAYQSFPHLEQTHLTNPYMFNSESAKLPVGYQRLAPGYSVIDPDRTKEDNSNIEMFRSLAEHIEKTLAENMEEDNEDDNKKMEPNLAVIETEADKMEADIGGKMVDMGVIQVGEDPTCVVVDERLYICSKFAKSGTDLGDEVDAESEAKEDTCKKVAIDDTLVDNAVRYGSWDTMETQAEKQVETVDKEKKASDMFTETDE